MLDYFLVIVDVYLIWNIVLVSGVWESDFLSLSISVNIYVYVPMYIIHITYLYIMYMDSFSNSFPI